MGRDSEAIYQEISGEITCSSGAALDGKEASISSPTLGILPPIYIIN